MAELRNQLVHGINLSGDAYIVPTEHAIGQIQMISKLIMAPSLAVDMYAKSVFTAQIGDRVLDIVQQMYDRRISFVPVFDGGVYRLTLSKWSIFGCILQYGDQIAQITLAQINQQEDVNVQRYTSQHTVLDIQSYLAHNPRSIIYLTEDGQKSDKLLGVVTEHDVLRHDLALQQGT